MALDVICSIDHAAKALRKVRLQQPCDQFARIDGDLGWEIEVANRDTAVHFVWVLIVERWVPGQHLEDQNS